MATFQVDVGDKSYHVDAETPEAAHAAVMQMGDVGEPSLGAGKTIAGTVNSLLNGATLGASDYLGATGRYLGDKAEGLAGKVGIDVPDNAGDMSFNDALKAQRGDEDKFSAAHPIVNAAANVSGAVLPALAGDELAVYPAITKAVGSGLDAFKAATGMKAIPKAVEYAAQGGVAGGANGLVSARGEDGGIPEPMDLLKSGGSGTVSGAIAGTTLPYVAKGVGAGLNLLGDFGQLVIDKLPFGQESFAGRALAKDLDRAKLTTGNLSANSNLLGPNANLLDIAGTQDPATGTWLGGRALRDSARAIIKQPGETADLAESVLKPRSAQGGVDMLQSVDRNLAPEGADYHDTFDTLGDKMKTEASPFFQSAFKANKSVADPRLDRILQTPAGQEAMDYARTRMGNKLANIAVPDPELTEQYNDLVSAGKMEPGQTQGGVASGLKLQTHDLIRQNLGEQLAQKRLQVAMGQAKASEAGDLADLYGNYRQALIDNDATAKAGPNSLKADGGDYEKGLKTYAGNAQLKTALENGRDFMNGDHELTASAFNDLSPGEQDMFRLGAARQVRGTIEQTGTVPKSLQNILNPASKQRTIMAKIFPNFGDFLGDAGSYARKAETARILGGSDTATNLAHANDLGSDLGGAAIDVAHGRPVSAATGAIRSLLNWAGRPSEANRNAYGKMLLDPQAVQDAIAAVNSRAQVPRLSAGFSLLRPEYGALAGGMGRSLLTTGPSNQ